MLEHQISLTTTTGTCSDLTEKDVERSQQDEDDRKSTNSREEDLCCCGFATLLPGFKTALGFQLLVASGTIIAFDNVTFLAPSLLQIFCLMCALFAAYLRQPKLLLPYLVYGPINILYTTSVHLVRLNKRQLDDVYLSAGLLLALLTLCTLSGHHWWTAGCCYGYLRRSTIARNSILDSHASVTQMLSVDQVAGVPRSRTGSYTGEMNVFTVSQS